MSNEWFSNDFEKRPLSTIILNSAVGKKKHDFKKQIFLKVKFDFTCKHKKSLMLVISY